MVEAQEGGCSSQDLRAGLWARTRRAGRRRTPRGVRVSSRTFIFRLALMVLVLDFGRVINLT